ncbi:MAG TPA: alpha/beta hydrolase [Acidimicrobiia bacterium]|nr:alpha/beta hydrolase [Acidimicrobiia bacterium]
MARRHRGCIPVVLILALAGCTSAGTVESSTTSGSDSTSTTATTSTTFPVTTTSVAGASTTSLQFGIEGEVVVPEGDGPFPAIVLVHGGGWVTGNTAIMRPLSEFLNENGYLTVNTAYQLATRDFPGYPGAVDDVACAVRYAASHPDGDGSVTVIGHSAGAHIGALVALTGDDYAGDCLYDGSGVPNRFVGLAGPYDVSRLGIAIIAFFGASPQTDPDSWTAGNPQELTDENLELDSLIMYGDQDGLVSDDFAVQFHNALAVSGSTSVLEVVEGARHSQMHDPELVGDLIVTWLER